MRRSVAVLGAAGLIAAAAASALLFSGTARSQSAPAEGTFTVAANDGYGVADCLTGGAACGQLIADAYCEAHGYRRATSFGPAAEAVTLAAAGTPPIAISCRK